jgi:hypothetical protein
MPVAAPAVARVSARLQGCDAATPVRQRCTRPGVSFPRVGRGTAIYIDAGTVLREYLRASQ